MTIGAQVLKFSELLTVLYEAANLVNERPIGKHPTEPDEERYLCPNDILLGRTSSQVPGGPFREVSSMRRYVFIQKLTDVFWKKRSQNYFPSFGDVVLIKDSNTIRGR